MNRMLLWLMMLPLAMIAVDGLASVPDGPDKTTTTPVPPDSVWYQAFTYIEVDKLPYAGASTEGVAKTWFADGYAVRCEFGHERKVDSSDVMLFNPDGKWLLQTRLKRARLDRSNAGDRVTKLFQFVRPDVPQRVREMLVFHELDWFRGCAETVESDTVKNDSTYRAFRVVIDSTTLVLLAKPSALTPRYMHIENPTRAYTISFESYGKVAYEKSLFWPPADYRVGEMKGLYGPLSFSDDPQLLNMQGAKPGDSADHSTSIPPDSMWHFALRPDRVDSSAPAGAADSVIDLFFAEGYAQCLRFSVPRPKDSVDVQIFGPDNVWLVRSRTGEVRRFPLPPNFHLKPISVVGLGSSSKFKDFTLGSEIAWFRQHADAVVRDTLVRDTLYDAYVVAADTMRLTLWVPVGVDHPRFLQTTKSSGTTAMRFVAHEKVAFRQDVFAPPVKR